MREAGYAVTEAVNGDEAMTILSEMSPDLIVTDVRMPGSVDGIQLLANVRATKSTLPIIVTSAHLAHVEDQTNGPTQFLSKPYEFDALLHQIERELQRH